MVRDKKPSIHVQGWLDPNHVATIATWLLEQGKELRSMADLLTRSVEALADAIIANGHRPIVEQEEVLEVLSYIGSNRSGKTSPLRLLTHVRDVARDAGGFLDPAVAREAMNIHNSGKYTRGLHEQHAPFVPGVGARAPLADDEIEVLPSVADDGEFSPSELRSQEAADGEPSSQLPEQNE